MGHAHNFVMPSLPLRVAGHASEAVAVFFVLSGLVIRFVVDEKEQDWQSYLVARLARIYPVAILALAVTFLADSIGAHVNEQYYAGLRFYNPANIQSFLLDILLSNELWFSHSVFGTNEAYWSLGFEVWYYILFGMITFLPQHLTLPIVVIWLSVAGPKIALYLPLWLMGAATYHGLSIIKIRRGVSALFFCASIILYFLIWKGLGPIATVPMFHWEDDVHEFYSLIYFYSIGAVVSMNILSFDGLFRDRAIWNLALKRCVQFLAGASFTLYLIHEPILALIAATVPKITASPLSGVSAIILTLSIVLFIAEIGERRKRIFASVIRRVLRANPRRQDSG
jgi:peptidoglycan/LPS O-acetylase OafA/YrhL